VVAGEGGRAFVGPPEGLDERAGLVGAGGGEGRVVGDEAELAEAGDVGAQDAGELFFVARAGAVRDQREDRFRYGAIGALCFEGGKGPVNVNVNGNGQGSRTGAYGSGRRAHLDQSRQQTDRPATDRPRLQG
jgi:hypothetical protein